jgi:Flp pilus assembly protein TadG
MSAHGDSIFKRLWQDQRGQTLPFMALILILFLGMAGITVDLGHAFICYRELQASTDSAALAGGFALSSSTATTASVKATVLRYSSAATGINVNPNLPGTTITTTLTCLTTLSNQGVLCSASTTGNNAVQVRQSATVPTYFIRALRSLGTNTATSIDISTVATAAMRGATNAQYNVAIVLDTTASMASQDKDASCGTTRIDCAIKGVQTLLKSLSPCTAASISSTCAAFDQVGLFTFPNVQANTAQNDYTCPTSNPQVVPYTTPVAGATWSAPMGTSGTYQITDYLSDYSSTNTAGGALNTSSQLTIATGGSTAKKCSGLQTPGGVGTYYAGAIYAALSSLAAEQAANPGSLNALIVLSDGDASSSAITANNGLKLTTTGTYPSLKNQCQQGITAAKSAPPGTTVYTIAYGAPSSGCSTDTTGISACAALQAMATTPANFYSDATASQNVGQCVSSSNPNLTLNGIFKQLTLQFTVARLISNDTT